MVEPIDCASLFGQVPHTILISHGERRPSKLRIPIMPIIEGIDEVDNTSRWGPWSLVYSNPGNLQQ